MSCAAAASIPAARPPSASLIARVSPTAWTGISARSSARPPAVDELRAISTFIRAAELGSFNKVAEAQGTTPQAVSKTIRQFEQHLGVRLFHRTTRNSALTEEGQRLLESIKPSMDGVIGALARARNAAREDEGLVRIAASASMGTKMLVPLLAEFQKRYPLIQVDLLLEDGFSDL